MPGWLIPPFVSRDGHDSLGRGLDPADIAAAVAAAAGVQQAKSEPWRHLGRAYRDPHTAQACDWMNWPEPRAGPRPPRGSTRHTNSSAPCAGVTGCSPGPPRNRTALKRSSRRGGSATACAGSPRPSGGPSANTARVSRRNCSATPWGCRNSRPAAAAVLEAVHAARTEPPGDSGTPPRCAIGLPWHRLGKWDRGTSCDRGGNRPVRRKPPSKDWARRGLSPFYAARMKTGPCCRGVEPGQRQALTELARGLAAARRGRSDHQLQRAEEAAEERRTPAAAPPVPARTRAWGGRAGMRANDDK